MFGTTQVIGNISLALLRNGKGHTNANCNDDDSDHNGDNARDVLGPLVVGSNKRSSNGVINSALTSGSITKKMKLNLSINESHSVSIDDMMDMARMGGIDESSPLWPNLIGVMSDATYLRFFVRSKPEGRRGVVEYFVSMKNKIIKQKRDSKDKKEGSSGKKKDKKEGSSGKNKDP